MFFAAMRQGTRLLNVLSCPTRGERAMAKARAREEEKVDGNREEEENEKGEKWVQK